MLSGEFPQLLVFTPNPMTYVDPLDPGVVAWTTPTHEQTKVWISAGVVGGIGFVLSLLAVARHLYNWNHPRIQRYYLRFTVAPAVLAVCAMGGLLFPRCQAMFVFLRTCYLVFMASSLHEIQFAYFGPAYSFKTRLLQAIQIMDRTDHKLWYPLPTTPKPTMEFFVKRVQLPMAIFGLLMVFASGLGQLLSSYGYWGFTSSASTSSWYALTVIIAASSLLGIWGLSNQMQALWPLFTRRAIVQYVLVLCYLLAIPFQDLIIGAVAQSHKLPQLFGLHDSALSGLNVINLLICLETIVFALGTEAVFSPRLFATLHDLEFVKAEFVLPDPVTSVEITEDVSNSPPPKAPLLVTGDKPTPVVRRGSSRKRIVVDVPQAAKQLFKSAPSSRFAPKPLNAGNSSTTVSHGHRVDLVRNNNQSVDGMSTPTFGAPRVLITSPLPTSPPPITSTQPLPSPTQTTASQSTVTFSIPTSDIPVVEPTTTTTKISPSNDNITPKLRPKSVVTPPPVSNIVVPTSPTNAAKVQLTGRKQSDDGGEVVTFVVQSPRQQTGNNTASIESNQTPTVQPTATVVTSSTSTASNINTTNTTLESTVTVTSVTNAPVIVETPVVVSVSTSSSTSTITTVPVTVTATKPPSLTTPADTTTLLPKVTVTHTDAPTALTSTVTSTPTPTVVTTSITTSTTMTTQPTALPVTVVPVITNTEPVPTPVNVTTTPTIIVEPNIIPNTVATITIEENVKSQQQTLADEPLSTTASVNDTPIPVTVTVTSSSTTTTQSTFTTTDATVVVDATPSVIPVATTVTTTVPITETVSTSTTVTPETTSIATTVTPTVTGTSGEDSAVVTTVTPPTTTTTTTAVTIETVPVAKDTPVVTSQPTSTPIITTVTTTVIDNIKPVTSTEETTSTTTTTANSDVITDTPTTPTPTVTVPVTSSQAVNKPVGPRFPRPTATTTPTSTTGPRPGVSSPTKIVFPKPTGTGSPSSTMTPRPTTTPTTTTPKTTPFTVRPSTPRATVTPSTTVTKPTTTVTTPSTPTVTTNTTTTTPSSDGASLPLYPIEQLRNPGPYPTDVNASKRELHLSDDDFMELFKMAKPDFAKLPAWKQDKLKRDNKLF